MQEAVAAPPALQDIVYPILSEKSLHFCEKMWHDETFTLFRSRKAAQKTSNSVYVVVALAELSASKRYSMQEKPFFPFRRNLIFRSLPTTVPFAT